MPDALLLIIEECQLLHHDLKLSHSAHLWATLQQLIVAAMPERPYNMLLVLDCERVSAPLTCCIPGWQTRMANTAS